MTQEETVAEAKALLEAAASKPVKKESKKKKAAIWAGIFVAAAYCVGASGMELGLFGVSVDAHVNKIQEQSKEIGPALCASVAEDESLKLKGTQILAGMHTESYQSDTLICHFEDGQTIPFMLIYDKDGNFEQYI
jgi:hypothetical protein